MTERRSPAPTIPEIKLMTTSELFLEAARVQGSISKINTTLAFLKDPAHRAKPEKALAVHERALVNLTSEMAARYVNFPEDRRSILYKMVTDVALIAQAYIDSFDSEKDNYYEQEFLKDKMASALKEMSELK